MGFRRSGFRLGLGKGTNWLPFHPTQVAGFGYWFDSSVASSFTIAPPANLLTNGTCESTVGWSAREVGIGSLSVVSAAPMSGNCIRVTSLGAGNCYALQSPYVIGKGYTVTGYMRSDGGRTPTLASAGFDWVGTTSTNWQPFSVSITAGVTAAAFGFFTATGAGQYVDINDLSVTLTDQTNVSDWADKYGTRSIVQVTASRQPLYVAIPYVEFDGINERLTNTWTQNQPYALFTVMKPSKSDDTSGTVLDGGIAGAARLYISAANTLAFTTDGANIISAPGQDLDAFHQITVIVNGASSALRVDGVEVASGNAGAAAAGGLTLGAKADGTTPGDPQTKDIAEIVGSPVIDDIVRLEKFFRLLRGTP